MTAKDKLRAIDRQIRANKARELCRVPAKYEAKMRKRIAELKTEAEAERLDDIAHWWWQPCEPGPCGDEPRSYADRLRAFGYLYFSNEVATVAMLEALEIDYDCQYHTVLDAWLTEELGGKLSPPEGFRTFYRKLLAEAAA